MFQWQKIETSEYPSARFAHTLVTFTNHCYLFGGCRGPSIDEVRILKDTWVYKNNQWSMLSDAPIGLYSHTALAYGFKMIVYGGFSGSASNNKVYEYDTQRDEWNIIEVPEKQIPLGRMGHSAILFQDLMIVFGGITIRGTCCDLLTFRLSTQKWRKIDLNYGPSPRAYHSAVQYRKYMYIYGGYTESKKYCNEVFQYDCVSNKWTLINHFGCIPHLNGIKKHSAVVFKNYMYVFGGVTNDEYGHLNGIVKYHLPTHSWEYENTAINSPNPRASHSAIMVNNEMLVFGGLQDDFGDNIHYHDFWKIVVASQNFEMLPVLQAQKFIDVIIKTSN